MFASGEKDMLSIFDHMLNFPLLSLLDSYSQRKGRRFWNNPSNVQRQMINVSSPGCLIINVTSDILKEDIACVDHISHNPLNLKP